jgi:hypothetical protein
LAVGALAAAVTFGLASTSAAFADAGPWWHIIQTVRPATIPPGGEGVVTVQAVNVGDGPTVGAATLSDLLPPGLSVVETAVEERLVPQVSFFTMPMGPRFDFGPDSSLSFFEFCATTSKSVSCTLKQNILKSFEEFGGSSFSGAKELKPFENFEVQIKVRADQGAVRGINRAEASGGSAPIARLKRALPIGSTAPAFGAEQLSVVPEEERGGIDVQAGSHPFQLTTTFALNQSLNPAKPPALPRNLSFNLPPGLVGNATAVAQCTDQQFDTIAHEGTGNGCPQDTALGVASITVDEPVGLELQTFAVPLFNLTPGVGEPARFGFEFAHAPVTLDTSVRSGADYGVAATVSNTTELLNFISSSVTIWGVPGDSRHDGARGWGCLRGGQLVLGRIACRATSEAQPPPFLTMPTACSLPFTASVEGVSWPTQAAPAGIPLETGEHGSYSLQDEFERPLSVAGCNKLSFSPSIEVQPDVQSASTSSGLTVRVKVPQEVSQNPQGLASSSVKDTTVALPQGVQLNPAGAVGLESCSESKIGFREVAGDQTDLFTPTLPSPFCPDASKIGTVKFKVPLIKHPLEGAVYLASQNANPFGSLVAIYVVAEDHESGILLKLAGEVHLTDSGQIISTLKNSPQAPLEEAEFHFFGGDRAPLATPALCGRYTTQASFSPWSGNPPVGSSSSFDVTSGPNGGPCQNPLPFAPTLAAGTANIAAGAFSSLTTTISRSDGNQDMQSVQLHMPPGLSGILAGVKLCPEAQANEGTCGPESEIGETIVSAGIGPSPVSVTGGKVYLTEKYADAPFGLSIVNPVKTGPFDLEHDTANPAQQPACDCVVVRAKIAVDPSTAALTITTDASGPHAIPHLIDGVPVQIKKVNVLVKRSGFTFNPTNCSPMSITGAISSDAGASSPVSVPFQVTNCAILKFAPKFSVSTSAKTSKAGGASLTAKLVEPPGSLGTQANITKVKVELPKQLPSRLTTLQKACTNTQFQANPAGCPAASIIGHATVHTPLLPVALSGPAIFVSHGGEAFPSLVIVLQGYGVTVDLVGTTYIDRAGITSTTFKTVPDTPFSTFELTLPQGRFSALAANLPAKANDSFCGQRLVMPSEFIAQNGAQLHRRTPVTVTGCAKKKALTSKQKLAKALKACRKKAKGKRAECVREARRRFGTVARKGRRR